MTEAVKRRLKVEPALWHPHNELEPFRNRCQTLAMHSVRLLSPATKVDPQLLDDSVSLFQQSGISIKLTDHEKHQHGRFSGTPKQRYDALADALSDSDHDVLLSTRGGYGCAQLVDELINHPIEQSPDKTLIGYSDITLLGTVLNSTSNVHFIHGPMISELIETPQSSGSMLMFSYLKSDREYCDWPTETRLTCVKPGRSRAQLAGGNLSIICSMIGTPWESKLHGSILIIEENFEYLFRIDRMMKQLKFSGVLETLSGIVLGHFSNMQDSQIKYGRTVDEIILDNIEYLNIPIARGAPFGHISPNLPISLFREVELHSSPLESRIIF